MTRHPEFAAFVETIATLRGPGGCLWDREQTHRSIARHMLEEAYEVVDAIESGDSANLREELGDVLLEVVLQCQIAEDAGEFTIDDVCRDINEKMIRRHPHVFGDATADNPAEVYDLWEQIKQGEKQNEQSSAISHDSAINQDPTSARESFLDNVPTAMPALMQAQKISRKVIGVGFEWEHIDDIWDQMFSEIDELRQAYATADKNDRGAVSHNRAVELEVGDVLFSFVNVAHRMGIDAEVALRASCNKFRRRWLYIEKQARLQGRRINELSTAEMNVLWDEAKLSE